MRSSSEAALLETLRECLGADGLLSGEQVDERYLHDWMAHAPRGAVLGVARPRNTQEVSRTLAACSRFATPVVPQGGRTGLAGGATPVPGCIVLSLERMSGVLEVDPDAATLTALAGTPMETIQMAARDAGLLFALDIGGRGSCQIGGNVSTNAGGNHVLRWGMAREQVLGLEVVLADGTVLTQLNKMLKNNAGYDLKQLFIGSEGTLGVVTKVVLRLHGLPRSVTTAMCATRDYAGALGLLRSLRSGLGSRLGTFEVMWPDFYELVTTHVSGLDRPLAYGSGTYVLVESMGVDPDRDAEALEKILMDCLEQEIVSDVVVAQSLAQREAFWRIRDASGELRSLLGAHVGFDVSIATGRLGDFVDALIDQLRQRWPEVQTVHFGHAADANVHIGVRVGVGEQPEKEIEELVYGMVGRWDGSISAEHGIGTLKRPYLHISRSPEEISVMRKLKHALDPKGILNPGKVLPEIG